MLRLILLLGFIWCPMPYIAIRWHHNNATDPVETYAEIDDLRKERRKVEVFRDGRVQFADEGRATGDTVLAVDALPPLQEIADDPQNSLRAITATEFEEVWKRALRGE